MFFDVLTVSNEKHLPIALGEMLKFLGKFWKCPRWACSYGFPLVSKMAFFGPWVSDGNASCGKLMKDGKLLSFDALQARHIGSWMDFWRYRKLHFFFLDTRPLRDLSSLTPIEHLFIAEEPIPHMVAELYQLLSSATHESKLPYIQVWERDLGRELTEPQLTHL